jgi:hypothetical protein
VARTSAIFIASCIVRTPGELSTPASSYETVMEASRILIAHRVDDVNQIFQNKLSHITEAHCARTPFLLSGLNQSMVLVVLDATDSKLVDNCLQTDWAAGSFNPLNHLVNHHNLHSAR